MSQAVIQPPAELDRHRGKAQEGSGLGEVTDRTKAADKKKKIKDPMAAIRLETITHVKTGGLG